MPKAVAPQQYIVAPDARLLSIASDVRRRSRKLRTPSRVAMCEAAAQIEAAANSYAEMATALAIKTRELAELRWRERP